MAGHSKWSKVKHYKGALDAKRGKIFAKFSKEIAVACKLGGGDPGFNPRLRTILLKARAANMPAENIERAIKKGTGELAGVNYEEITYEGYGPGGVAFLVEVLTDNKNRAAAEIRTVFTKGGGNMGGAGATKHLFQRKGHLILGKETIGEEDLLNLVLEAGAEDLITDADSHEVLTEPSQFEAVHKALEQKGLKPQTAEIAWVPITPVPVHDPVAAAAVLKLVEALEDHEDVQNVYASFDIPEAVMEQLQAG